MSHAQYRLCVVAVAVTAALTASAATDSPLTVEAYVHTVLRAHPGGRQAAALERAAAAEHKAARLFPDPVVEFARRKAWSLDGSRGPETQWSLSQTIPWPGAWSADGRASERQGDAFRAEATMARWSLEVDARSTFARLIHARAALEMATEAEADALALRDLTAKRVDWGEAREIDRIKTEVEWLRQQRARRSLERASEAAETRLRSLAIEPLPRLLALAGQLPIEIGPLDSSELHTRLAQSNPTLLEARAHAARTAALAAAARRGRIPDLDLTWFRSHELDKSAHGLQLALKVPLWNAQRGAMARAEAASALATAAAQRAVLELTLALARALEELDVASGQASILERQVLPVASRSLELARFSYQEGETSLLDLLDAQRTLRETQSEALAARLALALALAEVQRLVGPDFNLGRAQ